MIEIRFHGRGGQGAVTACNIVAIALWKEGKWAQSFPLFRGERRGAPVQAYLRISGTSVSDIPAIPRAQIYHPDHVVVLDPRLIGSSQETAKSFGILDGLKKGGWVIINSNREPERFDLHWFKIATSDSKGIAARHNLGSVQSRPVSTAILGAFSLATGLVGIESVLEAIEEEVPEKPKENMAAAREAYESVRMMIGSMP